MSSRFLIGFAGKYKDNEAIEFSFDLNKDVPEDVAQEMVSTINNIRVGGRDKVKHRMLDKKMWRCECWNLK